MIANLIAPYRRIPMEALIWTAGLVVLACTDPTAPPLLDLCVFKALGVTFCPGCGLGHGIAYLFRGAFAASFQAHPLAPFAAVTLVGRIVTLLREAFAPAASS